MTNASIPWAKVLNPTQVLAITTAYESGYGHGHQRRHLGNPYEEGTPEHEAYRIGVKEGEEHSPIRPTEEAGSE